MQYNNLQGLEGHRGTNGDKERAVEMERWQTADKEVRWVNSRDDRG